MGRRYDIGIRQMSEIHKALAIFGLEPGASQDAIQRRYKRLIIVWHPDRFPTDDGKKDAEEELKKINNANDVLKKHFASGHLASNCECQKPATGAEHRAHGPGPGPGPHRKPDDAEAQAKQRDEERKRKAAAEEAARKAAEHQKQQEQKTTQTTFEQAQRQQEALKWNRIRWQIAAGEAALFIGLCIFGNVGHGVKEWWHDFSWKWERDHAPKQEPAPGSSTEPPSYTKDLNPPYQVPSNPFGPVGPPPENSNPNMLPNGVMKPLDNSRVPIPNYPPSSTTTTPGTGTGFDWKPITPGTTTDTGSPSLLQRKYDWLNPKPSTTPGISPYEQVAPKLKTAPDSSTTTNTGSNLDLDKYIKH
jgi:curved DNA-binding protein CbpA